MGQVLLVRHGQASWGSDDYDVLSPTGEEQAGVVGAALASLLPEPPAVVVHGTMQRQRRTAELAMAAAGWQVEARTDARWDELDHDAVLAREPAPFEGEPDRRQFQAWFEAATARWTSGESDHLYDEPFPAFRGRVAAALDDLAGVGTAVVFTSGGPIAATTSRLLQAGTPTYLKLAPVVVNASVTRVVSGGRGLTLVSFNDHAHLPVGLLTYR